MFQPKIYFTITLLLSALISSAQQLKIVSAEDGAALPFATVINHTHANLVSANANGIADLNVQKGDSVSVSYVGFKTITFIFNSNSNLTIRLFKATDILKPLTVVNCKKLKKFNYSNKDSVLYKISEEGNRLYFGGIVFWKGQWNNPQWAVRLNPEKENAILNSFSFWLKKPYNGPKSAIKAPLIISFYDVTDSILPGNVLIENPIIYYPQNTGKQTLHLDSLHLRIPPNGIYVSFQCVFNDAYAWTETVKWKDNNNHNSEDTTITKYSGRIDGIYTRNFELAGFNPIKNNWQMWTKKSKDNNDLHGSIKCEAALKYCAD